MRSVSKARQKKRQLTQINANTERSSAWLSASAPKAPVTSTLRTERFEIELVHTKVNERGGGIGVRANSVTKAIED